MKSKENFPWDISRQVVRKKNPALQHADQMQRFAGENLSEFP